ncbi:bifunctional riboflavin kinase/FAD synthetase [Nautilia sp.]
MTVTIGGFDGMHLGHQALIKRADTIIVIEKGSNLTPGTDRCDYTTLPCKFFDLNDIKDLSPIEFINILKELNITKTVTGKDFRFGKNRSGDLNLLKKHFEVEAIQEVKIDGIGVHSRIIREFIKNGDIIKANRFLGHTYKIKGKQVKGQGLGSKELVPTININLIKNYLIPKSGVYITLTNRHPSLTFIGTRSTDGNFSIETHILMENGKWKMENENGMFKIEFIDFLRKNRKFDNLKELKKQIEEDINKTAKRFEKNLNQPQQGNSC